MTQTKVEPAKSQQVKKMTLFVHAWNHGAVSDSNPKQTWHASTNENQYVHISDMLQLHSSTPGHHGNLLGM